ncbi:lytic transglycosylase [Xaviernesmea oryzae]|uniref:Lytic transglycosylase n=1 Tax=Xaviernesmea oryzae TaxID=464029 RepID=A0A1Q9AU67_9HYPH|nr:lytic transglycosylase domain-containing protein [Xaviernesmea oryzae]OLP58922.1 lytic transglycosylase [Xaviernesmea oryzae]SEM01779.1 Transglycosylase SLT domain-containing protein [Xaviernesmea oryzae]
MPPLRTSSATRSPRVTRRIVALLLSGLPVCAVAVPSATIAASAAAQGLRDPYAGHITIAAQRFRIPEAWIRAVMRVESRGNPRATSPKGAMGLMQIMPETWADLRARHALGSDPYDPRANILAGAAYLRELYDRYGSPGFLAAYNAGPGRYEASLLGRALPAETRAYVAVLASAVGAPGRTRPPRFANADPSAWTRASLFAVRGKGRPTAGQVQAGTGEDETPVAALVRDLSAIVPQVGGLFVERPDRGEVR